MIDVDLNLLRVFDMLEAERSVTRAADRLGLTQSAVSHALRRLRETLGDPLFVRGPGGLQPTARATRLAPQLREGLARIQAAFAVTAFDPAATRRRFNVAAGSYLCAILMPKLIALLREEAPDASIRVWNVGPDLIDALDAGRLDLAFTGGEKMPARIRSTQLFEEQMVWIASSTNPLAQGPADLERIQSAPRVTLASNRDPTDGFGGGALRESEAQPPARAGSTAVVYDAATAIKIVSKSDAVAVVPSRYAEAYRARGEIAILGPGAVRMSVAIAMIWHTKADDDPGLSWLRQLVGKALHL